VNVKEPQKQAELSQEMISEISLCNPAQFVQGAEDPGDKSPLEQIYELTEKLWEETFSSRIGAGAIVTKDVPDGEVWYGEAATRKG